MSLLIAGSSFWNVLEQGCADRYSMVSVLNATEFKIVKMVMFHEVFYRNKKKKKQSPTPEEGRIATEIINIYRS